jgi:flagellar hook assembly protein FlgD
MRLTLHDLTGARVRTLAEGVQPAGPGRVHWDGRDHRGTPVRPGSYFARLETADGVRTRRLVVLP